MTEALNNKLSFTKRAWLSQHFLQKGLQWLLKYFKITEAQYQSPLIPLINFNNATMLKQNGSISTTSKYRRAAGKNLTDATRAVPRDFLPLLHICPFTQIFFLGHLIPSEGKKGNVGTEKFNIQILDTSDQ